jgi:putative spermidine/putrescine transport system substrate-binding protein
MMDMHWLPESGAQRRALLKLLAGASAGTLLPGAARAAPSRLVVANGGGKIEEAYQATVFRAWQNTWKIPILSTSNPAAKLKAMVEQGRVEWDVMQGPAEEHIVSARKGLFEPIDYSIVDRSSLLPGAAEKYFVKTDVAAFNIAWNTQSIARPPRSWKEVWNTKGRIGLWKRPFQTLEVALLADGVPKEKLYPLDVERALGSLDRIRDRLVLWDKGAEGVQLLASGEIDLGGCWVGRLYGPKQGGAPIDYNFDESITLFDAWAVPRGTPNVKEAMQLVALAMTPQVQANFAKIYPNGPTNQKALALLDAKTRAQLASSEENLAKGVMLSLDYWADHGEAVAERFNRWLLK